MIPKKPAPDLIISAFMCVSDALWVDTGFRKRSCSNNRLDRDDDSKKSHPDLTRPVASPDTFITALRRVACSPSA